MANRELREWLGITFADLLVYVGAAAIVAMFFVSNPTVDVALAVFGVRTQKWADAERMVRC